SPTDPVETVLDAIAAHPGIGLAVVIADDPVHRVIPGHAVPIVGIVTPMDLTRTLSLLDAAGSQFRQPQTRKTL
ncbi:MAG TPA: hypothetical protein VHX15_03140, partial [Frankiaceae bacterium]|nr:hypothetical protein [Frankiaceae bacterium]